MTSTISITFEQGEILGKVEETYGERSFEYDELTFLFLIINAFIAKRGYVDYAYVTRLKALLSIIGKRFKEVQLGKLKVEYPETHGQIEELQRRQEYKTV